MRTLVLLLAFVGVEWGQSTQGLLGFCAVNISSTPAFDAISCNSTGGTFNVFQLGPLTADVTVSTFINGVPGNYYTFQIYQGTSTARAFAWPTNVLNVCTISSTLGSWTQVTGYFDGTNVLAQSCATSDQATLILGPVRAKPNTPPGNSVSLWFDNTANLPQAQDSTGSMSSMVRTASAPTTGTVLQYISTDGRQNQAQPIQSLAMAFLPAPAIDGRIVAVTDATAPGSCTSPGGGSAVALCWDSGSAWVPLGGGVSSATVNQNSRSTGYQNTRDIGYTFAGKGAALTGTLDACQIADFSGTIQGVTLWADQSGSATVDVRTVAYSAYAGASSASSITGSSTPSISSTIKYRDTTLMGWTTGLSADTLICFHLTNPSTVTWLTVGLKVLVD